MASSSSDSDLSEDDFHTVEHTNRRATYLFPEKFSPVQMASMFKKEPAPVTTKVTIGLDDPIDQVVGTISADPAFYTDVMPYSWQSLTGTPDWYAANIRFAHAMDVRNGCLYGLYDYECPSLYAYAKGALGYAKTIPFQVMLKLDPTYRILNLDSIQGHCKLFNMKESILGDQDFISNKHDLAIDAPGYPFASFYSIVTSLAAGWAKETPSLGERTPVSSKKWLLILHQLQGHNVKGMTPEARSHLGDKLYTDFIASLGFKVEDMCVPHAKRDQGLIDRTEASLLAIRAELLKALRIEDHLLPKLADLDAAAVLAGRVFFSVPDNSVEQGANNKTDS